MSRKPKKEWVDPFLVIQAMKTQVTRTRSKRPLVDQMNRLSIKDMKGWGLLRLGMEFRHDLPDGASVSTSFVGKRRFVQITAGASSLTIPLRSKKLGKALIWYFVNPKTRRLCKTVFFNSAGDTDRTNNGGVYVSQYRTKTFSKFLQMEELMLAINGDLHGRVGPARGQSKLRKLYRLRRIHQDVCLDEEAQYKILKSFPEFEETVDKAKKLLKRKLAKLPDGWDAFLKNPGLSRELMLRRKPTSSLVKNDKPSRKKKMR